MLNFGEPNGTPFSVSCKPGAYINAFYGRAAAGYLETLGAQCSDGADLGHIGSMTDAQAKAARSAERPGGPYTSFSIWGDADHLISFNKIKGARGYEDAQQCETGAAVGLSGTHDGTYFNSLSVSCGAPASYCYNHIESPVCAAADAQTLNIACGTKWTSQCSARFAELSEALAASHCLAAPNDPQCACYTAPPDYIPGILAEMPQCWSAKCTGVLSPGKTPRIPSTAITGVCPVVKIGSDAQGGDRTALTPNIQIVPGATPAAAPPDTSNMLILVCIICAACGISALLLWYYYIDESEDSDNPDDPENKPKNRKSRR
jgi:hypothetical protein